MSRHIEDDFESLPEPAGNALREAITRNATGGEVWNAQDMFRAFEAKVSEPKAAVRKGHWLWRSAFITVAVVIVGISIKYITNKSAHVQSKTYVTSSGQRATVTLPDGSRVILAPESRLSFSSDFNKSSRTVNLDGEAYFSVTTHTGAPFVVGAGNQTTRVLGTSFSVRNYATSDSTMRVIVAEGRVQVAANVVGAGQGIVVTPSGRNIMLSDTEISAGLAWTDGRLVFVDAPVGDVIEQIERWYGVKFTGIDRELAASRFSTTLNGDRLTDNMLSSLGVALGRRLERNGMEIRITGK